MCEMNSNCVTAIMQAAALCPTRRNTHPPHAHLTPAASCNQQAAALNGGDILVLSVGTMRAAFDDAAPEASDPGACCKACQDTDGCVGWSFCSRALGCGAKGACDGYISALPRQSAAGPDRYPITQFGPHNDQLSACAAEGRWPEKTCTLRAAAAGSGKAPALAAAAAEGWVSGLTPKPAIPGCPQGFSSATCKACLAAKSPTDCFKCLQGPRVYGDAALAPCAGCAALPDTKLRSACISCVADYGPSASCATCLLTGGSGALDVERATSCFRCVADGGAAVRGGTTCTECFVSRTGGAVDTASCLACAKDGRMSASARAGCGACYESSVQDRTGCLKCLTTRGVDSDEKAAACGSCSQPGLQAVTGQCYNCLQTIGRGAAVMCARFGQVSSHV